MMHPEIADVLAGRRRWCVVTGDCLDILPTLPDGCVDAVVTDPPYGVGFAYASHDDTPVGYADWCSRWFAEVRRVSRGPVAITTGQANLSAWAAANPPAWWLAWWKPAAMGRCVVGFNNWEPIAFYGRPESLGCDVVRAQIDPSDDVAWHPCPKPVGWARKQVEMMCPDDGVVLDPFGGASTTAVAALSVGRRSIIIEKDEGYAERSRRRIAEADTHLFTEAPIGA